MERYIDKVVFQYKILAKVYDLMDAILFTIPKRNPRTGLATHIPNKAMDVLDVCCGTCNTAIDLAAASSLNRVVGIDISQHMLKVARNKIEKKGLHNIELFCMDAANTNLDKEFDAVTTSLSLHEMPEEMIDQVVSEMARVLKKGGKMYIIEWEKPDSLIGSKIFNIFPGLFEPKSFKTFLKMDWEDLLSKYCLKVDQIEKYTFTKLIIASKL
ncbi:MAG TPA: class I SAM-dependent methyltransferase [Clostridia bacterium]|nr:class I SAM-dependent methyltransferase [Clostridia bacterium]